MQNSKNCKRKLAVGFEMPNDVSYNFWAPFLKKEGRDWDKNQKIDSKRNLKVDNQKS